MFQKNVPHKNQNTPLVLRNFLSENRYVWETMWKNMIEFGRPKMTI